MVSLALDEEKIQSIDKNVIAPVPGNPDGKVRNEPTSVQQESKNDQKAECIDVFVISSRRSATPKEEVEIRDGRIPIESCRDYGNKFEYRVSILGNPTPVGAESPANSSYSSGECPRRIEARPAAKLTELPRLRLLWTRSH